MTRSIFEIREVALILFLLGSLGFLVFLMGFHLFDNPVMDALAVEKVPQQESLYVTAAASTLQSKNLDGNSMDVESIDVNGDGYKDLVIAVEFERNTVLINNGKGVLVDQTEERFPTNKHDSEHIASGDFDGDGDQDIIFVSEDDRTNEYYLNDGQGYFRNYAEGLPVSGISNVVESADFNEDGFKDLIIGNQGQNYLMINDQKGNFVDESSLRLPLDNSTTQDIELGDLDGDGDLDIVEANENRNRILINYGKGYFKDQTRQRFPIVDDQTREVELGDLDNDGDLDIFFANVDFGGIGNPQNRLLVNDGFGNFSETTDSSLPKNNFRTVGVALFDINNDGLLDLINGNRFNGCKMMVLINKGDLVFEDQTKRFFPEFEVYTFDFEFQDFDGDGYHEIYFSNFRGKDFLLKKRM